jgi:Neuraminidase-like domain/Salmonella virulence plasmid 28.1kDa A protein
MQSIIFPLQPGDLPALANLQDALQLFLDREVISAPPALRQQLQEERARQVAQTATQGLIQIFQQSQLPNQPFNPPPGSIIDSPTAEAMNGILRNLGAFEILRISGKIISPTNTAVGPMFVQIIDKTIGNDVALITVRNGVAGYDFTLENTWLQRGKTKPDIQARIFPIDTANSNNPPTILATSEIRYNASSHEILNVILPTTETVIKALPSEHTTLLQELTTHFQGNLRDLKEDDNQQDITYLANKSGWDARAVAIAALADQFSTNTAGTGDSIHPALFYTLFRAGLPANEDAIYQINAKTAESVWKQGIKQGLIPATLEAQLPQALERFKTLAVQRTLDAPAIAGVSSLKEMLTNSRITETTQQQQFVRLYAQHQENLPQFWEAVQQNFGAPVAQRLRVDGQLGYLTRNNVRLIQQLHQSIAGTTGITNPLSLIENGYYQAEKWQTLLTDAIIPSEIPGTTDAEKRSNYAEVMAAQMRLSYPTAVVAQMVIKDNDETPLSKIDNETPANKAARKLLISKFLMAEQGKFEIGLQPIEQYARQNNVQIDNVQIAPADMQVVIKEVTRIQRVHQITPSDRAMNALLRNNLDSAYKIAQQDRTTFVQQFKEELGGETNAILTHAKAQQVHNTVLNIATSYLTGRNALPIGSNLSGRIINSLAAPPAEAANTSDIIAYPTLENLFGEMDYCTCDHCRSILSPAAYLVNLLQFCDRTDKGEGNPQAVLLKRRPDIEHLPLTCENTNTPLPYIDIVNETLEYFVTNNLNLDNYKGHDIDLEATPEELLASPQFVSDRAYEILAGNITPLPLLPPTSPLPFYQSLENLRRYFDKFEASLPHVMQVLRKNDALERANEIDNKPTYGWRDILMEELRISRAEYRLLTDRTLTLQQLYGYSPTTSETEILSTLANAKTFTRRVEISYEDLIEIIKTRFVNPNAFLLPKLERLNIPFAKLKALNDRTITDAEFDALIPTGFDQIPYNRDVKKWVRDNNAKIMSLITLTNPTAVGDPCSFDRLELRYSNPDNNTNRLRSFEFVRLLRFIRLWKKLGWTITQTDQALAALYPRVRIAIDPNDAINLGNLDAGFLTLLPRLGIIKQVMDRLKLQPQKDLLPLLACFAPIDTYGRSSLYHQMFLSPALLKQDAVFAEDGLGNVLTDSAQKLGGHIEILRAALQLTDDELRQIMRNLGYNDDNPLTLERLSAIFQRGWLAHKLKLSVREFLLLTQFTGFDPFAAPDPFIPPTQGSIEPPDPFNPPILGLIEILQQLRALSLKPSQALYLIWNQDISGKSIPNDREIIDFARNLRITLRTIDSEYNLTDDPDGQIARAKMALVYGNATTDLFFGLLNNTLVSTISYSHDQTILATGITDAAPSQIAYDDFRKQLTFTGVLTSTIQGVLKNIAGVTPQFQQAIDALFAENQKVIKPLFERYPELLPLYDVYVFFGQLATSVDYTHNRESLEPAILTTAAGRITYNPERRQISFKGVLNETTRNALKAIPDVEVQFVAIMDNLFAQNQRAIQEFFASHPEMLSRQSSYLEANDSVQIRNTLLLESFLPQLKLRRKQQQVLQSISAATKVEAEMAEALLANSDVLHAANAPQKLALNDLITSETQGLSARFYFRDTETGVPEVTRDAESNLDYSTSNNPLPANTTVPGSNILAIWRGYLEAPENGFYNIEIEADPGATITLRLVGKQIALTPNVTQDGTTRWHNTEQIDLRGGTLYAIALTIQKVKNKVVVRWQTTGRGLEVIPATYLYSETLTNQLRSTYIRFLKVTSLATTLKLTAGEIAHLAAHGDYKINGQGWLNSLPTGRSPAAAQSRGLRIALMALLDFAQLKSELSPDDERLLTLLKDPEAANRPTADADSLLFRITRWDAKSFADLLSHFGIDRVANLSRLKTFRRIFNAYEPLKALGISASALINATTNKPTAITIRNLQSALRARYSESDWLNVLKPINDEMRGLQRDALVAYILHQMRQSIETQHIDTPDKLFEYFLMDVQMEPCMQTSRIRHALSSIQLFIERCLMNLETKVSPSAINAKQWAWMKRYRVWEANRKVFLYPENWLEPELRDDQSPFFKEAMSELLQGDITEDRAAVTLLNYLSKLEEVAKLEPCGIHFIENDSQKLEDDVAHVVARTAGANRKYFYRRREFGNWTPWDQIKLDIEDNPVIPVVWRDRLFLFWLRIITQTPLNTTTTANSFSNIGTNSDNSAGSPGTGNSLDNSILDEAQKRANKNAENIRVSVKAVLCWSEYYNGKWQGTKTSDINKPASLGDFPVDGTDSFDRFKLKFFISEESNALKIYISGSIFKSPFFLFYNTHSSPIPQEGSLFDLVDGLNDRRALGSNDRKLSAVYFPGTFNNHQTNGSIERSILSSDLDASLTTTQHQRTRSWDAPFFYEDSRHVFYVNTKERSVQIPDFTDYGYNPPTTVFLPPDVQIPPVVVVPLTPIRDRSDFVIIDPQITMLDPAPLQRFVTEDAYIKKGIVTTGTIRYGDKDIGLTGTLLNQLNQ